MTMYDIFITYMQFITCNCSSTTKTPKGKLQEKSKYEIGSVYLAVIMDAIYKERTVLSVMKWPFCMLNPP